MSWARPTLETIYQRVKADMESRITSGIKIPRVSLLGVLSIVFAGGIHLTYGFLAWAFKQLFVDTADSIGRERWARIFKLPQKAATYTTGDVAFTGVGTVDAGTEFTNSEGRVYTTDADFTIGVDSKVSATASEAGEAYNTNDTTFTLASPIAGVDSDVQKIDGFLDGADIESVEAWVIRLLQRFQNPPSSGTEADYERWALEVSGVGKAWCLSAEEYKGAGTVGVYVGTDELAAVPAGVLSDVEDYIEKIRPIPAEIDYNNINPIDYNFAISITPNIAEIRDAIDSNLKDLFILDSGPGSTILLSHIRAAIAAAGPDDYEINMIYRESAPIGIINIETNRPDTARFGAVTYFGL